MVDKLRHFAHKMVLSKRHQATGLDEKSTDVLGKQRRQRKGDTPASEVKTLPAPKHRQTGK